MDTNSLAQAFITRSFDYESRYQYSYSKIVGLQNNGPWVLKKDYIELEPNKQVYEIPAHREINELMWYTPSELTNILFDPWSFGATWGGSLRYACLAVRHAERGGC